MIYFFKELKTYKKDEFKISDKDFLKVKKYLREHIEQIKVKDEKTKKTETRTIKSYSFKYIGLIYQKTINKLFIIYPKYMLIENDFSQFFLII